MNVVNGKDQIIRDIQHYGYLINTKLMIEVKAGKLTAEGIIFVNYAISYPTNSIQLFFSPIISQYDIPNSNPPKYWVLPLINFVTEFRDRRKDLDNHPLRIFIKKEIPDGLTAKDHVIAESYANSKNNLIVFTFQDNLGFIEQLPDYIERYEKLNGGLERRLITALMVGPINNNSIDFDELKKWFPLEYLYLLGLATGIEVGFPWIEFRDDKGKLIRRLHKKSMLPSFNKGPSPLEVSNGIGELLTVSIKNPDFGKSYLNVAINQCIKGGISGIIEDRLSHFCRGIEALCNEFGLNREDLKNKLNEQDRIKIDKILIEASKQAQMLASEKKNQGELDTFNVISRIASRIKSAPTGTDSFFGDSLKKLLCKFSLNDADILEQYYLSKYNTSWRKRISSYRGAVTHRGYFDIPTLHNNLAEAVIISQHLHDILLRIIFKILNYNGQYCPTVFKWESLVEIDWVKKDTPPERLGYK
jgi:hypothetical protein